MKLEFGIGMLEPVAAPKEWLGEVGVHNLHGATHLKVTPNKHTI